jgi:hypothetical protein
MSNENLIELIDWPCELPLQTKLDLLAISKEKTFIRDVQTAFGKKWNRGVIYFFDGLASYSLISAEMKPLIGCVLGHNSWIGGLQTFNFPKFILHAEEIEPLSAIYFPKQKMEELAQKDPIIYKFLYSLVQLNQPKHWQAIVISHYPIEIRLIYALIELLAHKRNIVGEIPHIKITHQKVSNLTGLSRPRISEVFKQLQSEELISLSRGVIWINNVDKLYSKLESVSFDFYDPYQKLVR